MSALKNHLLAISNEIERTPYVATNSRKYTCLHFGCYIPAYARGLCNAHYLRKRDGKDMDLPIQRRVRQATCVECDKAIAGKGGWGLCQTHYRKRRSGAIKAYLIEMLGGCCSKCLQVYPAAVYDFHHLGDKDESISEMLNYSSAEAIEIEVQKCVLLCANCHRVEHHGGF